MSFSGVGTGSGFDEDALAGALLGGLDHGVELVVGDVGQPVGTLGVALGGGVHLVTLFDVGQAVVEQREDVGSDFLAETISRAKILIDPDLHGCSFDTQAGGDERLRVYMGPTVETGSTEPDSALTAV